MPYISQSFIDDLPNQINIVDLISKRLSLKKTGSDYRAPCPFHGGKNNNFAVNSIKQFYHCFKCSESGGAISFVQKFDNLDFVETIETIAKEFGLTIEYDTNAKLVDPKLERYRHLSQKVAEFYVKQLKTSLEKKKAVTYAKKRGISGETAKRFALGFASLSNNDLLLKFEKNEQDIADLQVLGLLKEGQYGQYDFFRDRLMFPIHNTKGNIIAFGGRSFDDKVKAKYLNSSENPIFSKSRELYGLFHARKYSRLIDYILVVEGYMDVVTLHQAGITKVVAALGTATTTQHLQILARTTNVIVFCFDGDEAGRTAAWKALKTVLSIIKANLVIKFLFLPDGEDPDTLIKKESVKVFESRIGKADTLSKFLFKHVKSQVDLDTVEGKTLFLEKILTLINQVTYDTYKQQLVEGVAKHLGQSVEQIQVALAQQSAVKSSSPAVTTIEEGMPLTVDFYNSYYQSKSNFKSTTAPNTKALMSKIISLLLNYPTLANTALEARVKGIDNSAVLLEIVRSAQLDENISAEDLIQPFKQKKAAYNRLKRLCMLNPYLNEKQAEKEFLSAVLKLEQQQVEAQRVDSIRSATTSEEQKKVMQEIEKNKNS